MPQAALHAGQRAPDFELPTAPDHRVGTSQFRGRPVGARLLPGRLEPGLRRPDGALPGGPAGVRALRRRAARHLGGQRLVPPGVRRGPAAARSRCWPTSSPRARSPGATASYTHAGRQSAERALFVHRRRRRGRLELPSRRSASTRAPTASSTALEALQRRRWRLMTTPLQVTSSTAIPGRRERDHVQGPADAPVTLVEYGDYQCPYCGAAYPIVQRAAAPARRRTCASSFRNFPLTNVHPHAETPPRRPRPPARRGSSGRCTTCSTSTRTQLDRRDLVRYGVERARPRRRRASTRELARHAYADRVRARLHQRRPQRRQRHADVLHQRRAPRRRLRPGGAPRGGRRGRRGYLSDLFAMWADSHHAPCGAGPHACLSTVTQRNIDG